VSFAKVAVLLPRSISMYMDLFLKTSAKAYISICAGAMPFVFLTFDAFSIDEIRNLSKKILIESAFCLESKSFCDIILDKA
jgi:hypothetical protein